MFLTDKSILKTLIFVNAQGDNEILYQVSGAGYQASGGGCQGGVGMHRQEMMVIRNPYLGPCLLFVGRFSWVIMNNNFVKSLKYREMQQ